MKRLLYLPLLFLMTLLSGCEAIAGIFKAGVWTGVIIVAVVIIIIIMLVSKKK